MLGDKSTITALKLRRKALLGTAPLLLGSLLVACGSSSQSGGCGRSINGNWYATDPMFTSSPVNPISGVGLALTENNGILSGNITTYLVSKQIACGSLAFDLPASGTLDKSNHLTLGCDGRHCFL